MLARQRPSWPSAPATVAVGAGLLATGICVWQLTLPGVLAGVTGYDDGVYFAAALRLASGALPYRDFVFVQPPGIAVLMSPVALLSHVVGERDALALARVLTALVAGAVAGLTAWLVRRRGRVAMAIAGGAVACFPMAVVTDHTLALEPYVLVFVLLGAVLALGSDQPSRRRLVAAGALLGFAGAVKLWAVFPFVALLICLAPRWRSRVLPVLTGAVASFGIVCLPFFVAAPGSFFHEVLADQVSRAATVLNGVSTGSRLVDITGLAGVPALSPSTTLAAVLVAALALLATVAYGIGRRRSNRIDVFVLVAALLSVSGLLTAPEFYQYYAYFTAPFLAALLAISVTGTATVIFDRLPLRVRTRRVTVRAGIGAILGGSILLIALVGEDASFATTYLQDPVRGTDGAIVQPGSALDAAIPAGACVVFDEAILAIEASRLTSSSPGCPQLVDPYGMWLSGGGGAEPPDAPPYPSSFVATWRSYFEAAQYVVEWTPGSDFIPWTPALTKWFDEHYALVSSRTGAYVYVNIDQ